MAKVTTQQDYSIDQSQSSYMDPQTQIKPKMFLLLMSAVTINIWHVFIAKTRLLKRRWWEKKQGGAVIIHGRLNM